MRVIVTMNCQECKRKNYTTTKNKKNATGKLELNKYCRACKKHTKHKEGKK